MSELTEYFVRHYSLVLDNDQETYEEVKARIKARHPGIWYHGLGVPGDVR